VSVSVWDVATLLNGCFVNVSVICTSLVLVVD